MYWALLYVRLARRTVSKYGTRTVRVEVNVPTYRSLLVATPLITYIFGNPDPNPNRVRLARRRSKLPT